MCKLMHGGSRYIQIILPRIHFYYFTILELDYLFTGFSINSKELKKCYFCGRTF